MKKNKNVFSQDGYLSEEELTILNAEFQNSGEDRSKLPPHDQSDRAHVMRFAKRNVLLSISIIIVVLAIIGACVFGAIMLGRYLATRPNTSDYTVYLGSESYEVPYHSAMRDGILYLDIKKIANFSGFVVSGSETKLKFTASADQYLRFENESPYAVISGNRVEMSAKAFITKEECWVPFSFLQKVIDQGITLKLDTENNIIKITRQLYSDTKTPADFLFVTGGYPVIQSIHISQSKEIDPSVYPFDITPYLSYINPQNADPYLILANKQNPLGESYEPNNLTVLQDIGIPSKNDQQQLCQAAASALKVMLDAMKQENPNATSDLLVTSSYRSYSYQEQTYYGYVNRHMAEGMSREEAEAKASEYSARPGESEHQTGLCLDFIIKGEPLDESFAQTAAFTWLSENAHLYGFILRYPQGKSETTGYQYEPWHYRFVGRDVAVTIYEAGMTLEEYLELN